MLYVHPLTQMTKDKIRSWRSSTIESSHDGSRSLIIGGWWWYHSLTAHQHQKGHTVPKQVIMIATSIQIASLRTALCESIRYQAKSEQNVRQDLIPRGRHVEAALMNPINHWRDRNVRSSSLQRVAQFVTKEAKISCNPVTSFQEPRGLGVRYHLRPKRVKKRVRE